VTLNISAEESTSTAPAGRRALAREVVAELTSWNPREFIGAFRRWHSGSLSLIHLNVLTLLEADGPLSMSHLAEGLDVSLASATGIVDRMEQRGLVERRRDADDRRVVSVHVAPGGKKVFEDMDQRRRAGLTKLLTRLNERELRGLLAGHQALRLARTEFMRKHAETDKHAEAPTPEKRPRVAR
jgi:DNA-binding MarR family transcriptional regulator